MGKNSSIEWTDHSFSPWIGCQKVSPGCDRCYAETRWDHRFHRVEWGPHGERSRTSDGTWREPLAWNREAREVGHRYRVFCAPFADWLDNKVPQSWRDDLAELIDQTPNLDWLLLTKRIENFDRLSPWRGGVPPNVWLGVTCEDQAHFDRRWPVLASIVEARVRFVSYEPALGPLSIGTARPDWIICGGESGKGCRPMDLAWARDIRDQCTRAGVPFFMKQLGGHPKKRDDIALFPEDLRVREGVEEKMGGRGGLLRPPARAIGGSDS